MSEATLYFVLAQLFSISTAAMRLALAFAWLSGGAWLVLGLENKPGRRGAFTALYLQGLSIVLALTSAGTFGLLQYKMPYPNPFVARGWLLALILGGLGFFFLILERRWTGQWRRLHLVGYALVKWGCVFWLCQGDSFSRSDRIVLSVMMCLSMAWTVAYFGLSWQVSEESSAFQNRFNVGWGILFLPLLVSHILWLHPILAGLPAEGEFYPFVALYHWFLVIAVLLYLGNLYIQYWLKLQTSALFIVWRYLMTVTAITLLWFLTNIFDTLAL